MKRMIAIIAVLIQITACYPLSFYFGVSDHIKADNGKQVIAGGLAVDYQVTEVWSLGISLDLYTESGNKHNLLYCTSVDLDRWIHLEKWRIKAKGGFGWGHHYTDAVTDHNYHTYQVGMIFERKVRKDLNLFAYPSVNCQTYAEHIGFSKDRAWIQIQLGVAFDL